MKFNCIRTLVSRADIDLEIGKVLLRLLHLEPEPGTKASVLKVITKTSSIDRINLDTHSLLSNLSSRTNCAKSNLLIEHSRSFL